MATYIPMDYPIQTPLYYPEPRNNFNSSTILLVLLILLIAFVAYKLLNKQSNTTIYSPESEQHRQIINNQHISLQETVVPPVSTPRDISISVEQIDNRPAVNPYREYDYRVVTDPLVAPRRRDDYDFPVLPYPTRGYPTSFKKMGLLIDKNADDNDHYKILILMGRRTYRGSNMYDYYAIKDDLSSIKFDIKQQRELQNHDKVKIHPLRREYTVVLDRMLDYSYDPYFY
jgi:hypothetical protein